MQRTAARDYYSTQCVVGVMVQMRRKFGRTFFRISISWVSPIRRCSPTTECFRTPVQYLIRNTRALCTSRYDDSLSDVFPTTRENKHFGQRKIAPSL